MTNLRPVETLNVSIVSVSFNTSELLRERLPPARRDPAGLCAQVLVVDNNSWEGPVEMIRPESPSGRLFRGDGRLESASANDIALELVQDRYRTLPNRDASVISNRDEARVR